MTRCIFDGLTEQQANCLADWFEGHGEQDCNVWFGDRNIPSPLTDVSRKAGWKVVLRNGDILVHCK